MYMVCFFLLQTAVLLLFWYYCFRHPHWNKGWCCKISLFLLPFLFGCIFLWFDLQIFSTETLRHWHDLFCCFSTLAVLLLLPQWYKLMWCALQVLPNTNTNDHTKLIYATVFSVIMVFSIIFFFALYFLWLGHLSGYTQGLRSAGLNYQPVLLDLATAFAFSFSCYFSLGYGPYYPYGHWFHLLVFLECLISLVNNGIILFYAFHLLFERKS